MHFKKKGQVYNLNISEVIDSEKYGYSNARNLLLQNTLRESTIMTQPWQHFYQNFPLIQDTLSGKTSLLLRSEMLGLFGNALSADDMYSRH